MLTKLIYFKFFKKILNRNIEMILYIGVFFLYITFIFIFSRGRIKIIFIAMFIFVYNMFWQ